MSLIDTVIAMKREYIRATGKAPARLSCGVEFYNKLLEESAAFPSIQIAKAKSPKYEVALMVDGIRIDVVSSHSETKCHHG